MNENKASKPILIFSLIAILIVTLSVARSMAGSAPTYDGTQADLQALLNDETAYSTENADGAAAVMVDENNEKTAASNVVYSVVFNYRGYDTLGESFILIGAIAGTTAILRRKNSGSRKEAGHIGDIAAWNSVRETASMPEGSHIETMDRSSPHYHKKSVIVRCGSDALLPLAIIYGWYIILHGAMSPGGGFQGGVLVSSMVMLIYLAYGVSGVKRAFHPEFLHKSEMIAEIFYVAVALAGAAAGLRFCYNFVFPFGQEESAMLMNDAVGYHVMAGISGLLILMIGTLDRDDMKQDRQKKYHPANASLVHKERIPSVDTAQE